MFGMTLLERQLRTTKEAGLHPTTISVLLPPGDNPPAALPDRLGHEMSLQWVNTGGSFGDHLTQALQQKPDIPLLALEADAVVDARLLRHIGAQSGSLAARGGEGAERTAVLRLESGATLAGLADAPLHELADESIARGTLLELPLQEVPTHIRVLRRDLPPNLFRVTDAAKRDDTERFLFQSNYKGSTDFFTKYVYPPLVWRMVRPLARWRVHPNVVTAISIVLTLWAVPLFAQGRWVEGLLMAYAMSVLDSVDGKLARLTFRSSWLGNILDHGLDLIHPPLWYFGWAWALGGGTLTAPIFQAAIWMVVFYFLDRLVVRLFTARTDRSLHSYTPLDVQLRTYISRRNINLPLFTVGLLLGIPSFIFGFIVLWQFATLVYHYTRLVQFWDVKTTGDRGPETGDLGPRTED
ncbi:MAG: CDP-alcohol phosphatidyltransferase family protein [Deltaproteobacteria bacterium]|nr:CDP-alcohol phosphatidyltransferase family protein [Deltaproteobacteria bacterium]